MAPVADYWRSWYISAVLFHKEKIMAKRRPLKKLAARVKAGVKRRRTRRKTRRANIKKALTGG
jgi:hypothetical protein